MKVFLISLILGILFLFENTTSIRLNTNSQNEISEKTHAATDNHNIISKEKANLQVKVEASTESKKNLMKNTNTVLTETDARKLLTEEEV